MKAGIPQQMYILLLFLNIFALVLAIKFFSILSVLAFIVFVLLTVIPMYIIHSEDPGGVSGNPRKFRHSALWNFLGGWSAA
ncbi:TPA: hypothetical protein MJC48_29025 [Klebsiella pneumoniae]|nr:hypothetical protein [Klebsiella pneumoniae]HBZ0867080.1 hypothetical protein [Klebsiella pneumoniae]